MLIHGARAVLLRIKYDTGGFGQWVHRLEARAPRNKVIVAIANKLARIAWPCCPAATNIDINRCPRQPDEAVEKTLRLESTKRFPLFHRHDDGDEGQKKFHHGLLSREDDERTVKRRAGKPSVVNAS